MFLTSRRLLPPVNTCVPDAEVREWDPPASMGWRAFLYPSHGRKSLRVHRMVGYGGLGGTPMSMTSTNFVLIEHVGHTPLALQLLDIRLPRGAPWRRPRRAEVRNPAPLPALLAPFAVHHAAARDPSKKNHTAATDGIRLAHYIHDRMQEDNVVKENAGPCF